MRAGLIAAGRSARVILHTWKAELSGAAEYRTDLVTGTVVSSVWLAVSAAPLILVSSYSGTASEWDLPRMLFLLAIWYLMDGFLWMILFPNLRQWSESVRMGTLDVLLLKPVDSLILSSLSRLSIEDLPKVLLSLGLAVYASALGGGPGSPVAVAAFLLALASGFALLWAIGVLSSFKVLTQVRFDGTFVLHGLHNLARVPVPLYGNPLRLVFTAVLPLAFFATVPTQVFFGLARPWMALVALGVAAVAVVLTLVLWRREIGRYAGVMG